MYKEENSEGTPNAISSPESAAGRTHCPLLDGQQTDRSGPDHAPVSLSVQQASDVAQTTNDIYGRSFAALSRSAHLQQFLESRLHHLLAANGSPEYALIWKHWDMESGQPICALRASVRRTSGNGFTGWPSPRANDSTGEKIPPNRTGGAALKSVAGWATPICDDGEKVKSSPKFHSQLCDQAHISGWVSPTAADGIRGEKTPGTGIPLNHQVSGMTQPSSPAETVSTGGYRLNPHFSRWLMGYPAEWLSCVDWEMPLSRKSRRRS